MENEQNEEIGQINTNESNNIENENNINNLNDNQKEVKEALNKINLFKKQNAIEQNNNQNIQIPINNENIINNEFDFYSGNKVDELNQLNINNNYEEVSMENQNLKRQIIELMTENQNLQRNLNNKDLQFSPSPVKDNNIIESNQFNYYSPDYYQNENIEQIMKTENDNNFNNISNNNNNIMNPLYKNQK